jgi:uncharacterized protein YegP (UPF0339 family)
MSRFQFFTDRAGQWRWRLVSRNGRKIATSGEAFSSRANARRAAMNVKSVASGAVLPADDYPNEVLGRVLARIADRGARKKALINRIAAQR